MVDVESSVLHSLGDNGSGYLLPAHYESKTSLTLVGKHVRQILQQQYLSNKVKTGGRQMGSSAARFIQSLANVFDGMLGQFHISDVGAVHRQTRRDLDQCVKQLATRKFSRVAILGGEFGQLPAQRAHLDAQQRTHNQLLFLIEHIREILMPPDECGVCLLDLRGALGIYERSIGLIQVVVAGGPAN